ncbi:uncharacterized protein [Watersipora subatra]|uniref:uncharacterized protein n=1 Tax=Watersipora subatra TaxID=2589382 RepID=UPI00355B3B94
MLRLLLSLTVIISGVNSLVLPGQQMDNTLSIMLAEIENLKDRVAHLEEQAMKQNSSTNDLAETEHLELQSAREEPLYGQSRHNSTQDLSRKSQNIHSEPNYQRSYKACPVDHMRFEEIKKLETKLGHFNKKIIYLNQGITNKICQYRRSFPICRFSGMDSTGWYICTT